MKNNNEKYKNYLYDLGLLIKEEALEAKKARDQEEKGSESYIFEEGYLMAFHRVISLMQQEAEAFEIPLEDLRLHDIVPDRDLV